MTDNTSVCTLCRQNPALSRGPYPQLCKPCAFPLLYGEASYYANNLDEFKVMLNKWRKGLAQ